ncbi:unnamed protein product [Tetraodon nigroviridis]|uniref:(spotted green pufferfish) hypothetical protein n=1 Tax=Tetraodon nigroviridis TaxID=99883 RepID=Q4RJP7_TETNG|nr:unnamed protein product [Tetraodon nigroviridis]
MVMTGLEMGKGTITKSTIGGLWETWNQHGHGSQTEKGSNLTLSGRTPTQCRTDTDTRRQHRGTALHASRLDMNRRGQSCFCLLGTRLIPNVFSF